MKVIESIFSVILRRSVIFSIITIIFIAAIAFSTMNYLNPQTIEGQLTDKYQKRVSESKDHFYIVIKDKNNQSHVISNSDLYLKGKFNSADIQGELSIGKNYEVKTTGYRIPIFNKYPILNKIKEDK